MNRKTTRGVALLSAATLLSGCYSYSPAKLTTVPAGESVRVTLTRRGQLELIDRGSRVDETVLGTFVGREGEQVLLRIPVGVREEGFFRSAIERELPVPAADILAIDRREFSTPRTALFVGGVAGGASLIVGIIIAASARAGGPGDPGPEEIRIPLFGVRVP